MHILEKVCSCTMNKSMQERGKRIGGDIWQWDMGVAMYGLVKAYETTNDAQILHFIKSWVDYQIANYEIKMSINTTAPLLGVLKLLEAENNSVYYNLCEAFANWCLAKAPRSDLGAFEHSCTENAYPNQIWADTLFMGCLFLVKWGKYVKNDMYIHEAIRQFKLHYHFLKDSESGLIVHGYYCNEREQKGVLWGRGNTWFAVASAEMIDMLGDNYEGMKDVRENFVTHLMAVIKTQAENGAWHTVMNDKSTYCEMSCTAGFVYALKRAVSKGVIENRFADRIESGYEILEKSVNEAGIVENGSVGTCVMPTSADYNNVGVGYSYFTQGLAIACLADFVSE